MVDIMLSHITRRREKKWVLNGESSPSSASAEAEIASALALSPITAKLLFQRGCHTPQQAKAYLRLENEMLGDPFLLRDMDKAVQRIIRALTDKEKIAIYGDYDVDGVTAVCTLLLYLRSRGADVTYYIPNRVGEGYGVSLSAIEKLRGEGVSLVITVDTGITASAEISRAKEIGVDFVVTDHHECQMPLPEAEAVVDPHRPDCPYPFKELAGVGVVFKLISALEETISGDDRMTAVARICSEYADLIAIGTVADVMPICNENKLIVKLGLRMIEETRRPGLRALMETVRQRGDSRDSQRKAKKQKITSSYIGYTLAPRINAAGRIRSASIAVELFLAEDSERAEELSEILCVANRERQAEENRIMEEAKLQIEEQHDFSADPVIVLSSDEWHHGVIGIVSSRITERFGLPSILVSFEGSGSPLPSPDDVGKGSGRSIKGLNLAKALMHCQEHLVRFGGHELAAGLSVTRGKLDVFRKAINDYARETLTDEAIVLTLQADCEISPEQITMDLVEELQLLEPFGVGNPTPVFMLRTMTLNEITPISGGKHTRLTVSDGRVSYQAMCFSLAASSLGVYVGDRVDLLFTLDINEWAGRRSVQLIVKDIRLSEDATRECASELDRLHEICDGAPFASDENVLPSREEFAATYLLLRNSVNAGIDCYSYRVLHSKLYRNSHGSIGYIKLGVMLRVLEEMGLIGVEEIGNGISRYTVPHTENKIDLEKSVLLQRLRAQLLQNKEV